MAGKHIRVTGFSQPPEHTGGTLDIGEEKSKGLHKQSVSSPPSRCVRPAHYLDRAPSDHGPPARAHPPPLTPERATGTPGSRMPASESRVGRTARFPQFTGPFPNL